MVDGEDGERGVARAVGQWQCLGDAPHGRRGTGRALRQHHVRGLDRDDDAIVGLVRARARADVAHAAGVPQGVQDLRGDAGIGTALERVRPADRVVRVLRHG